MSKITHKQQTNPLNCMATCLAMILNADVDEISNQFDDGFHKREITPAKFLREIGFDSFVKGESPYDNLLLWDYVYILHVPSLNILGGSHAIVADLRHGGMEVFDPNKGKINKKYYISPDDDAVSDLEIKLHHWLIDLRITL